MAIIQTMLFQILSFSFQPTALGKLVQQAYDSNYYHFLVLLDVYFPHCMTSNLACVASVTQLDVEQHQTCCESHHTLCRVHLVPAAVLVISLQAAHTINKYLTVMTDGDKQIILHQCFAYCN